MVSSHADSFRAAVAAAAGFNAVHDVIWESAYDWVLEERFRRSKRKVERDAAVREHARYVRDLYMSVVNAGSPRLQASKRIPREEPANGDPHVSAAALEQAETLSVTLSGYEQDRAWAFSLEVAALADTLYRNRIQRFRDTWFGGQPVSASEAEAWLLSQNARLEVHSTTSETTMLSIDGELVTATRELLSPQRHRQVVKLPSGEVAVFAPNSPVAKLFHQGDLLSQTLPWTADEAAWFILTGQPPSIQPLQGSFSRMRFARREQRGVITIEVEPWISEKTVAGLYRDVRARVLLQHDARHRGLAVWRFVESQHVKPLPTLRDVWRELDFRAKAERPVRKMLFHEVWRKWRAAHHEISTLTLAECCRRWNAEHADTPRLQFRNYSKFRAALLSGIEHMNSIAWPDYARLNGDPAGDNLP
jgi:hypothetical protein